jgi:hypothetical protein
VKLTSGLEREIIAHIMGIDFEGAAFSCLKAASTIENSGGELNLALPTASRHRFAEMFMDERN